MGYNLMTCLKDEKGVKHSDRKKINKIASEFYANLYENKGSIEGLEIREEEPLPKFMESEVERVISTLKEEKRQQATTELPMNTSNMEEKR